jgi:hypothetical protein
MRIRLVRVDAENETSKWEAVVASDAAEGTPAYPDEIKEALLKMDER